MANKKNDTQLRKTIRNQAVTQMKMQQRKTAKECGKRDGKCNAENCLLNSPSALTESMDDVDSADNDDERALLQRCGFSQLFAEMCMKSAGDHWTARDVAFERVCQVLCDADADNVFESLVLAGFTENGANALMDCVNVTTQHSSTELCFIVLLAVDTRRESIQTSIRNTTSMVRNCAMEDNDDQFKVMSTFRIAFSNN